MRYLISALTAVLFAAPVFAQGITSSYAATPTGPVGLAEITIGETLAAKGDEYGEREFDRLIRTLTADLERELREVSLLADGEAGATLHVVIEDATPNRPTFAQQGGTPGLSFESYGRGGAHVMAELRAADGSLVATYDYSWTTPSIRDAQYASVWTDTNRTFDRFSSRLAASLRDAVNSGS
ncbi:hypothetical protein HXX25_01545 [Hyphobacterium sp. CCMP332]|jgi:hypothetical protein|uniref:hypothetical protein n=1 Tax=Hyphobacterium sp. CCMP332 TaxID=2749086 RepID=UPI00164FC4B6|nr:hypothetical protein [Hyphobacterium sp. CCMP332]QNL18135.1 hypothetical protein HXX25_01545 [Hyphobacterium sp. CCMP332]